MERDTNRQHAESLVRRITEERERFVSAWQRGARTPELNEIRENIRELDNLLWETTLKAGGPQSSMPGERSDRAFRDHVVLRNNRP